jgi:hypothetical protein
VQHQSTAVVVHDGQILFPLLIEDLPNLVTHGDISLLFSSEEIREIKLEVPHTEFKLYDNSSALVTKRLSCNLYIVLFVSPSGTVYHDVCVHFPAIYPTA